MAYSDGGGRDFGTPDFSDAIPPDPVNQGDAGPEGMGSNRVDEHTFEDGAYPTARDPMESGWQELVDVTGLPGSAGRQGADIPDGVRGYVATPIGGTFNPGHGTSGRSSVSAGTSGPTERSNAS